MKKFSPIILFIAVCICLAGCSQKVRIGKDYLAVTPQTLPDGHPGTQLYYTPPFGPKKLIWGSYFALGTNAAYRDGILVFGGDGNDTTGDGTEANFFQLYAVRGPGPIVLLTQRVAQHPLFHWTKDGSAAGVQLDRGELTPNGIKATFTHQYGTIDTNLLIKEISWDEIKAMVDEGKTATNRKTKYWGSYVVLPIRKPDAPHQ